MTTLISGIIALIAGLVFVVSIVSPSRGRLKVGDRFGHVNPGIPQDPDRKADPFVQIEEVLEIKEGRARVRTRCLHSDGRTTTREDWEPAYSVGRFDTKLPSTDQ